MPVAMLLEPAVEKRIYLCGRHGLCEAKKMCPLWAQINESSLRIAFNRILSFNFIFLVLKIYLLHRNLHYWLNYDMDQAKLHKR